MLNKIFGLFRNSKKTTVTLTKPVNPYGNMRVNTEEIDRIIDAVDKVNFDDDVETTANNLGIKLKYRDNTTGELYEVEWTADNFNKVMSDKNLCLVFS